MRALREIPLPDEGGAEQRAWQAVLAEHRARPAHRARWRLAAAPAAACAVAALALSPAGAAVGRLIGHALGRREAPAAVRASLPSGGGLLASGPGGVFLVSRRGAVRRLGPWPQAQWSPHGLYIAAAGPGGLTVIDPEGVVEWVLARPAVSDPRWYEPTGYRLAYLSGDRLRVVAGDGTGDHLVASRVAQVAPAWRPGLPYELAYVTLSGRIEVRDATSGRLLWRSAVAVRDPLGLGWSADGRALVAVSPTGASLLSPPSRRARRLLAGPARVLAGALSPDGRTLALLLRASGAGPRLPFGARWRGTGLERVEVVGVASGRVRLAAALAGAGPPAVSWSPDGRWLLISRRGPEPWLLVPARAGATPLELWPIQRRLTARAADAVDGWCCEP